jgi:hypothetical protein
MEEKAVKNSNPDFYRLVRNFVQEIPDARPFETTNLMKKERWNPWGRIYDELVGIGTAESSLRLINIILDEDISSLQDYIENDPYKTFHRDYPTITYLLSRAVKGRSLQVFLLHAGLYDLFKEDDEINPIDFFYVSEIFPTVEFFEKHTSRPLTTEDLMVAINRNNQTFLKFIMIFGKEISIIDWETALDEAVIADKVDLIKILLRFSKLDETIRRNFILPRFRYEERKPETIVTLMRDGRYQIEESDFDIILHWLRVNPNIEVLILFLLRERIPLDTREEIMIDVVNSLMKRMNDSAIVRRILEENINANIIQYLFKFMIRYAKTTTIKILLEDPRVDPSVSDNSSLISACYRGDVDIVKLLLKDYRVDPTVRNSNVIMIAVERNNIPLLKLLLKDGRADPSANNNEALLYANDYGKLKISKILLKDPRVRDI